MSGVKHNYIDEVLAQVRFKFDHGDIRQELEEHIEDMLSFAPPMEDSEAESYVREQMGDPVAVGQALDREHHVVLGWIWRVARWMMVGMIVVCLPTFCFMGRAAIFTVGDVGEMVFDLPGPYPVEEKIEVNKGAWIDDTYLYVDKVVRRTDDRIILYYYMIPNPLVRIRSTIRLSPWMYDDCGNNLQGGGSGSIGGFIDSWHDDIENLSSEAKKMIINYSHFGREFYLEIPLEWEVVK